MIQEVKAYKTTDGQIFAKNEQAIFHQNKIDKQLTIDSKFSYNLPKIKQYITDNHGIENPEPFHEGEWSWECYEVDNPIGICIYEYKYDHECCVYCGEPEERK